MTRRTPFLSLLLLLFGLVPATAQRAPIVMLSPQDFHEVGAVSDPALIPALRGQTHPTIASNGDGWLVAWSDSRYARAWDSAMVEDVFATVVDSSGNVLHPEGIPVAPTWASDRYPSAVWTGSSYLIVWSSPIGMFGTHLDANGALLRSGILAEITGSSTMKETAIARSGERLLLLWSEGAWGGTDVIRWRLLDAEGTPLTAASTLTPPSFGSQRNPSVGGTADGFVIAWEEIAESRSHVFAISMTEEGRVGPPHSLGKGPTRTGTVGMWTSQASPSVASREEAALIVWTDGQIRALEFAKSGPASETLTIPSDGVAVAPHVVRNGASWIVAFSSGDLADPAVDGSRDISSLDLYVSALVSPISMGPVKRITAPEAQIGVALASNGREVFIAWTDFRLSASTDHPFGARLAGDLFGGTLGRALLEAADLLAYGRAEQRPLAIVAVDGRARALWAENLDDDEEGLFTRGFTSAGVPTDERRLLARGRVFDHFDADIGAAADGFAVAWGGGDGVFATLLTADGEPKGDPILVDAVGSSPAVASDGRDFLVAWDLSTAPQGFSPGIRVRILRDDATMPAPPVALWTALGRNPRATWTGSRYLVVWAETSSRIAGSGTTGRFVSGNGSLLGIQPLEFARLSKYQSGPWSVASSGAEHLIGTSGQIILTDAEGSIVEVEGPWPLGPALSVAWVGNAFAVADAGWPGTAGFWPIRIAPAEGGRVLAIAAKRTPPLPLAHDNLTSRAVLATANLHPGRKRLAARE